MSNPIFVQNHTHWCIFQAVGTCYVMLFLCLTVQLIFTCCQCSFIPSCCHPFSSAVFDHVCIFLTYLFILQLPFQFLSSNILWYISLIYLSTYSLLPICFATRSLLDFTLVLWTVVMSPCFTKILSTVFFTWPDAIDTSFTACSIIRIQTWQNGQSLINQPYSGYVWLSVTVWLFVCSSERQQPLRQCSVSHCSRYCVAWLRRILLLSSLCRHCLQYVM